MTTTKTKMNAKEAAKAEAIAQLQEFISPGDTVYTVLRSVSSSGMSRQISLFIMSEGQMLNITGLAARALGYTATEKNPGRNWAIKVGGCGMDMGFHLVYNLSSALFRDAYAFAGKDAGYSLNQWWL